MFEINPVVSNAATNIDLAGYQMQSPGISVIIDAEKKIVYFEEKFTERFGYGAEDIYSDDFTLANIIDVIQLERMDIQVQDLRENKNGRFIAYTFQCKNGARVMCYVYAYKVKNMDIRDAVQLYVLPEFSSLDTPFISFDTREMFLEQFNSFDFGTFEWIIANNRVFWSEGIYRIYEIEERKPSFEYNFVSQFTHPEDKERVAEKLRHVIDSRSDYEMELRIVTARNNIKVIQTRGKVVTDADGQALKLIGSIRDITRQRNIEIDLEEKIEELNQSNAELEEFAYVASHDLQEPLRKISTFCDRLSERYSGELQGDGKLYVDRIIASADNMRMLIHNLLEFSRVSKTNEPLVPVSLEIIVREVTNDLELLIEETGSAIETGKLPKVDSSIVLMKQLFTNLINNAIKFRQSSVPAKITITSKKLSSIEITRLHLDSSLVYYDVTVQDNGIGFDNEYADRIFQIFQRLHGKADYPGSGIGLAICKKIVEKHNGYIYAEGREGEGAIFHIILPEHLHSD